MALDENNDFIEVILDESVEQDECANKYVEFIKRIKFKLPQSFGGAIGICRGAFQGMFSGSYCIREDASGRTEGLYKLVNGKYEPVLLSQPNTEIRIGIGTGNTVYVPPAGWVIDDDPDSLARYAVGTSPNWKRVPIVYVGI